jgi:hypothetical protein
MSKHCIRAYEEIYAGIDDKTFEAIPADKSNGRYRAFTITAEATLEKSLNLKVQTKPTPSFTAKINELTS